VKHRITAAALLILGTALALWMQADVGIARDETVYMRAGTRYADWWIDTLQGDMRPIDQTWGGKMAGDNNPEHPPLMKTLFGLSEKLLHDTFGIADEQTAYRAPSALFLGILVALVFLFAARVWDYETGLVAAALALLLPRGLFHAGLACFDAPIATLWFATLYAYWRSLESNRWAIAAGVLFGLALATKHNALILPFVVYLHFLAVVVLADRRQQPLPPWFGPIALMLGPIVLVIVWPFLWKAPIARTTEWIEFHLHHTHYNFEYLGRNWNAPTFPRHVALVTTLFTVPVVTLAAGALGAGVLGVRAWRRESADARRAPGLLLLLSMGAAMGPFFLGSTPIFGAEKHWSPAIASICIAAAVGIVWAARRAAAIAPPRFAAAFVAVLGGLAVAASATEVAVSHPYALTHYNALAGGAPGGADLGMNRQFWGVSARGVLPWIGSQPQGTVYAHDASPAWNLYAKWGLLWPGYPESGRREEQGIARSDYALVIHELHFNRHDYLIWEDYGTVQPAYVLTTDGVPIVSVYQRPSPRRGE
jgi:4-amino-4-deoxy-L-arabinose transferase-like glycosyltransferase